MSFFSFDWQRVHLVLVRDITSLIPSAGDVAGGVTISRKVDVQAVDILLKRKGDITGVSKLRWGGQQAQAEWGIWR